MIVIYAGIIFIVILILLLGRREIIPEEWVTSKYQRRLYQSAYYLYKKGRGLTRRKESEKKRKLKEAIRCIEPTGNVEKNLLKYYLDKISICLVIGIAGTCITTGIWISHFTDKVLQEGNVISRNPYGGGNISTTLSAKTEDESISEKIKILVSERKYTEEELAMTYRDFTTKLPAVILGENPDLQAITSALNLVDHIEGYPFTIGWEVSDYTLLDSDGNLGEREPEKGGEKIILTAVLSYDDWKQEYPLNICILPREKGKEEKWKELISEKVSENASRTKTETEMRLPSQIDGKNIVWEEKKEDISKNFAVLIFLAVLLICFGKDRELQEKVEKRKKEMLGDYPEIVGKMTLLLTAGMTIRSAWKKMVYDYIKKREKSGQKRYAYEEMLITCYEMESGVPEIKSYDNFAKRCRVANYLKLGVILGQNLKKGSFGLQQILQREAKEAFEERKSKARKIGEEAGTKLLLPMMLMLAVVIVIIIVPAFLSFSI